jgi:hypothetical protein
MRTVDHHFAWLIVAVFALGVLSCGPGGDNGTTTADDTEGLTQSDSIPSFEPNDLEPGMTATFEVDYAEGTSVISESTVTDRLISVSADGTTYTFDRAAEDIAGLTEGAVVVLSGVSLRRIDSITTTDDTVTLETSSATLNEAIRDGTLGWECNVDFASAAAAVLDGADDTFTVRETAGVRITNGQRQATAKFTIEGRISGWDVKVELEPMRDRINADISASFTVSGATVASLSGVGYVSDFTNCGLVSIEDGVTRTVELRNEGMRGEMEVRWSVFNAENIPVTEFVQLSVPASIPFAVQVGPVPLILKLKAVARIVPEVRFEGSSSTGSFKVTYSSAQGFNVTDEAVSTLGGLTSSNTGVSGETVSAGFRATGVGVGIEFPRVEVALPGEPASAFITVDTFATSLYNPEEPCQEGSVNVKAIAGFALSLFGVGVSDQVELWRDEFFTALNNRACP